MKQPTLLGIMVPAEPTSLNQAFTGRSISVEITSKPEARFLSASPSVTTTVEQGSNKNEVITSLLFSYSLARRTCRFTFYSRAQLTHFIIYLNM